MFNIGSYLEKFKRIEPPGDTVKNAAEMVFLEVVGVKIEKSEMTVKNGIIFLTVPAVVKNEVYMNKKRVIEKIGQLLGTSEIQDIR